MVVEALYLVWSYGGTTIIPSVKLWWYNHYTSWSYGGKPLYLVWIYGGMAIIPSVQLWWYNHYT
jgi:hypothetical protein